MCLVINDCSSKGTSYKLAPAWVLANQLIKNKSYTKLLCNIKPDGSMIWQKLNATATGQGTIIQI